MSETTKFELSPSVSILVAGVLVAGAIIFTNYQKKPAAAPNPNEVTQPTSTNVPAPSVDDHIIGSLSAPTILIEYSDFQCPFCSAVHPTIKRIVEESNGQIAWIYRNFPLESIHPEAKPSAQAAECIAAQLGNTDFWKFADTIFADQNKMNSTYYEQLAVQFGANVTTYKQCVAANTYAQKIDKEANDAMSAGANGTPYTVIHTAKGQTAVFGAVPYVQFKQAVDAATK